MLPWPCSRTLQVPAEPNLRTDSPSFRSCFLTAFLLGQGGLLCAVVGLQEIYTRGFSPLGVFFAAISIGTLLLPMQSVAVAAEGIESIPIFFRKRVVIPWDNVQKVELRDSRGWILIHGKDSCITFTRSMLIE
jgi:hypothetical protein